MSKKRVGVILSGCGFMDGAEIHEAVMTLLALDRADAEIKCFAPDTDQMDVVDHLAGKPVEEKRNVLRESARIARGDIVDVAQAKAADLDALVLPGGFGAAKNLSDFARSGDQAKVHPEVSRVVREMHDAGKPLGFWCIAPAVAAAIFRDAGIKMTIGNDAGTAAALEKMGARHENQPVDGITVDAEHKVVTTPCYMLATRVREIEAGVSRAVSAVLEMA